MITRRSFIESGAGWLLASDHRPDDRQRGPSPLQLPLGLQLYTVGDALRRDFTQAIQAVADIGYRAVECGLTISGRDAAALKSTFNDLGLRWESAHVAGNELKDDLAKTIDTAHAVGLNYLVCAFPPFPASIKQAMTATTLGDWKANADAFNKIGEQTRAAGIRFAYHNHNIEFRDFGGVTGYDTLLAETDPGLVKLELDCGWMVSAGYDPVDYLKRYPGRYAMLHLKDLLPDHIPNTNLKMTGTEVGRGIIDWRRLLREADRAGVRGLYVEQEPPFAVSSLDSVHDSYRYLRGLRESGALDR
jgi:sugar phosphate isomerase/epimerase